MMKNYPILFASIAALGLGACAPQVYDPAHPNQSRNTGMLTGAALGGIFGATRGGSGSLVKAAAGAVIGGAVGSMIGSNLDAQAKELSRDLTTNGATVVNNGNNLVVTMPQDLLFATDSSTVRPDLQRDLNTLAGSLNRYPDTTVQIVGNTDSTGDASYNMKLSRQRAEAVERVLLNAGVPISRMETIGRGKNNPIASNDTVDGRALNRRVEFVITPNS